MSFKCHEPSQARQAHHGRHATLQPLRAVRPPPSRGSARRHLFAGGPGTPTQEPTFIPKLKICFADFPCSLCFINPVFVENENLMRFLVRVADWKGSLPTCMRSTEFSMLSLPECPQKLLEKFFCLCNGVEPLLCAMQFRGPTLSGPRGANRGALCGERLRRTLVERKENSSGFRQTNLQLATRLCSLGRAIASGPCKTFRFGEESASAGMLTGFPFVSLVAAPAGPVRWLSPNT